MNPTSPKAVTFTNSNKLWWAVLLLSLAIILMTVSSESIWLDEGDTAMYAIQPSFADWWKYFLADRLADCQMPLTMLTAWISTQCIGSGEFALRAQNFCWALLALFAFYRAGRLIKNPWLPMFLVIQPFFWFYMDEARPYAAEIAGGAILLNLLVQFSTDNAEKRSWIVMLGLAAIFIFSVSMLCAVTLMALLVVFVITDARHLVRIFRANWVWLIVYSVPLALLTAYYVWTFQKGTISAHIWKVDFKSTAFVFYELIGCLGLGPSLDVLREQASRGSIRSLALPFAAPALLAFLLFAMLIIYLRRNVATRQSLVMQSLLVIAFVSCSMIGASFLLHKPLWGRHFSPILPFVAFIEAIVFQHFLRSGKKLLIAASLVLILLLGVSSLQIRYAPRFAKDDYRGVAQLSKAAIQRGELVWWSAAEYPGIYYRVPLVKYGQKNGAIMPHDRDNVSLTGEKMPDIIVLTRPEVYDHSHYVAAFISSHNYSLSETFKNFKIFSKSAGIE